MNREWPLYWDDYLAIVSLVGTFGSIVVGIVIGAMLRPRGK